MPLSIPTLLLGAATLAAPPQRTLPDFLETSVDPATGARSSRGTYRVYEDREARSGRMLDLQVVVLHATGPATRPDPVFFLAGGPGQNAASLTRGYENHWARSQRDIVFVSQRGTGGSHRLDCPAPPGDLQSYLDPLFDVETYRAHLARLTREADLTRYSTPIAMDDLHEVRGALGYEKINLIGGSYGTRAALVYMRRHGPTARTAILNGVAPLAFTNPLFHARSAQEALDLTFAEVAGDPQASQAFPELETEFAAVLRRLDEAPALVEVTDRTTGESAKIRLDRAAFAEALRVMMYSMAGNRRTPLLIHRAFRGDFREFAQTAVDRGRGLRNSLALGMLLCVTAAEDVARIPPESIEPLTAGTFLGADRVRQQMAVCEFWPRSALPADFGEPVRSEVPTLILSGTLDPVTPPRFGEIVAQNFPSSLHLVAPGAHGIGGPCIQGILQDFLEHGSVRDLDTSCVEQLRPPTFELPAAAPDSSRKAGTPEAASGPTRGRTAPAR